MKSWILIRRIFFRHRALFAEFVMNRQEGRDAREQRMTFNSLVPPEQREGVLAYGQKWLQRPDNDFSHLRS